MKSSLEKSPAHIILHHTQTHSIPATQEAQVSLFLHGCKQRKQTGSFHSSNRLCISELCPRLRIYVHTMSNGLLRSDLSLSPC